MSQQFPQPPSDQDQVLLPSDFESLPSTPSSRGSSLGPLIVGVIAILLAVGAAVLAVLVRPPTLSEEQQQGTQVAFEMLAAEITELAEATPEIPPIVDSLDSQVRMLIQSNMDFQSRINGLETEIASLHMTVTAGAPTPTLEVTPELTPEATAEATSEAAIETRPEATAEATSEVTVNEATQEATEENTAEAITDATAEATEGSLPATVTVVGGNTGFANIRDNNIDGAVIATASRGTLLVIEKTLLASEPGNLGWFEVKLLDTAGQPVAGLTFVQGIPLREIGYISVSAVDNGQTIYEQWIASLTPTPAP